MFKRDDIRSVIRSRSLAASAEKADLVISLSLGSGEEFALKVREIGIDYVCGDEVFVLENGRLDDVRPHDAPRYVRLSAVASVRFFTIRDGRNLSWRR